MKINEYSLRCLQQVLDKKIKYAKLQMNISGSQSALTVSTFMRGSWPDYYGMVRKGLED